MLLPLDLDSRIFLLSHYLDFLLEGPAGPAFLGPSLEAWRLVESSRALRPGLDAFGWFRCVRERLFVTVTGTFGDDARTKSSSWRGSEVWGREWAYEGKGSGGGGEE
jgi:hypothetical protein